MLSKPDFSILAAQNMKVAKPLTPTKKRHRYASIMHTYASCKPSSAKHYIICTTNGHDSSVTLNTEVTSSTPKVGALGDNPAENTIRPFVIGRKNWLFSASQHGAHASANLYSLIETAKANDLEPYAYSKKVFTDLPNAKTLADVEALLPWHISL